MRAAWGDISHLVTFVMAVLRFGFVPLARRWLGLAVSTADLGRRLRQFLDANGLVYRKLGQYLAMRFDLLPADICAELDVLFQGAAAMPFSDVERLLGQELGRPWEQCFATLHPDPVGSASVAQVHLATSFEGERLAVKVQRAGIHERFVSDTRVMRRLAKLSDMVRLTGVISLLDMFEEFVEFTERELNFETEGLAAERLSLGMSPYGSVPRVHWSLTTRRLLTMDFVEGETFLTICKLRETGRIDEIRRISDVDLDRVVDRLADECFRQLFSTGFFHGDPHPGNVILRRDGTFVFLDCGITGDLPDEHRRDLSAFVENLALGRFIESAHYYTRLCILTADTDMDAWMNDVATALASWYGDLLDAHSPVEGRHMGSLQGKIAVAMRRYHVRTRPNQLLVWRALVLLDTTTLRLPIRFNLVKAMRSFFQKTRGDLRAILLSASARWPGEAVDLCETMVPAARHLLSDRVRAGEVRVLRSRSRRPAGSYPFAKRAACAIAGTGLGALAAGAGPGTTGSLGVLASVALLLVASRE